MKAFCKVFFGTVSILARDLILKPLIIAECSYKQRLIRDDIIGFWDKSTMRGQPSVSNETFRTPVPRCVARTASLPERRWKPRVRLLIWVLRATAGAGVLFPPCAAIAQNPVITIDNELINDTRLTSGLLVAGPPEAAREMAIVDAAMADAADAASGLTYPTVAYTGPAVSGISVDAAALSAGYTALQAIFANAVWHGVPGSGTGGSASIQATVLGEINATYATALNGLGLTQTSGTPTLTACNNPVGGLVSLCGGIKVGTVVANANLTARGYTVGNNAALDTADGSATAILNGITRPYTPANNNPGTYIPPANRPAMFPQWGIVTPSGLTAAQMTSIEATVPGPPAVTSALYAQNLMQTECQGSGTVLPSAIKSACAAAGFSPETTAEAKAALFWNDPGTTYLPPGHWLSITDSLCQSRGLSISQCARLTSLVSQAQNDAGIGAWKVKYQYNLWRPVTAIQDCASWNANFTTCDPSWSSLIATPPHPDYLAGHPAFSGAAATVLENFFNTDNIPITSTSDAYCNGGTPLRATLTGPIIACVVMPASTTGLAFVSNNVPTIYAPLSACAELGGVLADHGGKKPASCTIGSTTYLFNPSESGTGCNDIVNGGANDSLLICPITETFQTISDASQGPNGAEFSRVVGGIHTPFAVEDALNLGNAIGEAVASENNIPEPAPPGEVWPPARRSRRRTRPRG